MAKRKIVLVFTAWVEDRSDELRATELEGMGGEDEYGGKLEDLAEYMALEELRGWSEAGPQQMGGRIEQVLNSPGGEAMVFEGSDCQVTLSETFCVGAAWITALEGERPGDRRDG